MPIECKMGSQLQRCSGSMEDVLYEDLYSVHMSPAEGPKPSKDIMNMLHIVCLPTESKMGSLLQRCNGSMKDVLYEDLLYIVYICSQTSQRAKASQRYN